MDTISISAKEARDSLAEVINRVAYGGKHYILTRRGSGLVGIVPIEELQLLEKILRQIEDEEDIQDAEEALKDVEKHGTISADEMKKYLGLNVQNRIRQKRKKT